MKEWESSPFPPAVSSVFPGSLSERVTKEDLGTPCLRGQKLKHRGEFRGLKGGGKVFWFSDLGMNPRLIWSSCGTLGKRCCTLETHFPRVINGSFCSASFGGNRFNRVATGSSNSSGEARHSPRGWGQVKSKGGSKGRQRQFLLPASENGTERRARLRGADRAAGDHSGRAGRAHPAPGRGRAREGAGPRWAGRSVGQLGERGTGRGGRPGRAGRPSPSSGQGAAGGPVRLGECRRRRGQPGGRRGLGCAPPEAGQEGLGGAAALSRSGRGACPRYPWVCPQPQAPA